MDVVNPQGFYAYQWSRREGFPFYVGKGKGDRYLYCGNNLYAQRIYNKAVAEGRRPEVLIYPCESEEEAFFCEKELIALWGRLDLGTGCLCNHTDGGDGASGLSPEALIKKSEKKRNS